MTSAFLAWLAAAALAGSPLDEIVGLEPHRRPTDASPVTDAELRAMVSELAGRVEAVAGRSFTRLPEVVLADRNIIGEVVFREQAHLLRAVEDMPGQEADENARRSAARSGGTFAGKYGFLDGKLYVAPLDLEESVAFAGAPAWILRPLLRVVIAHELTHALQDQHLDLDRAALEATDPDAIMALNCAMEGHAVWVHEQVGEAEGLGEAVEWMARLLEYDAPIRRRMDPDVFYQTYVYGLGREFVAYHARQGGNDEVWRVLAAPPTATRMIVDPSLWDDPVQSVGATAQSVMRRASRRLGPRAWRAVDSRLGDYDLRDQLVRAGADADIADALDMGWNSRLVGGAMAGVEVQVLRFSNDEAALAYVDGMIEQAVVTKALVGDDPHIRADAGAFDRVRADRSGRERFEVRLVGPADHLGRIWVARGSDVVAVVLVNAPASDREVATSIQSVFRALGRHDRPAG